MKLNLIGGVKNRRDERAARHRSLGINCTHRSYRSSPSPAKLLKGVEENSVTQTGRLRSFRGKGRPIGSVSNFRISTKPLINACNFARGVLAACENPRL